MSLEKISGNHEAKIFDIRVGKVPTTPKGYKWNRAAKQYADKEAREQLQRKNQARTKLEKLRRPEIIKYAQDINDWLKSDEGASARELILHTRPLYLVNFEPGARLYLTEYGFQRRGKSPPFTMSAFELAYELYMSGSDYYEFLLQDVADKLDERCREIDLK